jgi:hypothetical protein
MNKVVIAGLFDKVISSVKEAVKLLAEKEISVAELNYKNVIRTRENYEQIKYLNGTALPKGMEAHIVALMNGLS